MNSIQPDRIKQLLTCKDNPCITLVLSTQNAVFNRALIQARYKQLCHELKDQLATYSVTPLIQDQLLRQCDNFSLNQDFWRHLDSSLIVYLSEHRFETLPCSSHYGDSIHISDRFQLKYLLPHVWDDLKFHVLSIQHHEVHLYSALNQQLIEHSEEHFPQDILEVTEHKGLNYRTQGHSAGAQTGQSTGYVGYYSGAGEILDEAHQDLVRFYTAIDAVLSRVLKNHTEPLILVGDLTHMHLFKNITHYPHLSEKILASQASFHNLKNLYQVCLENLAAPIENEKDKAIALVGEGELKKHTRVRLKFTDIVKASHNANIETLLLWPDEIQKDLHDDDMIESIAREVYLNKGKLYPWVQTAAILRHSD